MARWTKEKSRKGKKSRRSQEEHRQNEWEDEYLGADARWLLYLLKCMLNVRLGGLNFHEDTALLFAPKHGNGFQIATRSP